jgi:ATP-binding cassette subfamily F protein 3
MLSTFKDTKEQEMRAHLGSFGIHGNLALQKMSTLSGGQKSRVVFAAITYNEPQLLILDEPTNHLDFETIEHLTESIQSYNGAVIIVSHDQALISNVVDDLYVVTKGSVKKFEGEFSDYVVNYQSFQ